MPTLTKAEATKLLTTLPPGAMIEVKLSTRQWSIDMDNEIEPFETKQEILDNVYSHLQGEEISLSEAQKKYNVHR